MKKTTKVLPHVIRRSSLGMGALIETLHGEDHFLNFSTDSVELVLESLRSIYDAAMRHVMTFPDNRELDEYQNFLLDWCDAYTHYANISKHCREDSVSEYGCEDTLPVALDFSWLFVTALTSGSNVLQALEETGYAGA